MEDQSVKHKAARLRQYRLWHRYVGILLAILLLVSSLTGILLAWKKEVDILQPPTLKSAHAGQQEWLAVSQIMQTATKALQAHTQLEHAAIDRLDIRPEKGIVKVLFAEGYWEVQVDGYSGAVLSVARRHADWIEHLHDGSIISELFKLASMNILGGGLLLLLLSGVWLWIGPKRIRHLKKYKKA